MVCYCRAVERAQGVLMTRLRSTGRTPNQSRCHRRRCPCAAASTQWCLRVTQGRACKERRARYVLSPCSVVNIINRPRRRRRRRLCAAASTGVCALRREELARRGEPNTSRPMLVSSSSSQSTSTKKKIKCIRVSREARPPPRQHRDFYVENSCVYSTRKR